MKLDVIKVVFKIWKKFSGKWQKKEGHKTIKKILIDNGNIA